MRRFNLLLAIFLPLLANPAGAADRLAGPVPATVLRVVDGDTVEVEAHIWLGQTIRTLVRIKGVDAPELHGRCARERDLAEQARAYVTAHLGGEVELRDIVRDKYGGRVVARIAPSGGGDISVALIGAGLGRPYGGGHKNPWCGRS